MPEKIKNIGVIVLLSLLPTIFIWLPFFLRLPSFWNIPLPVGGMQTIVANYDGPLYLVVAKTFYNGPAISSNFEFPLPNEYYAAHLPLYPILIRVVGLVTNFPYAMLLVTILSSIAALYYFRLFIVKYVGKKNALLATAAFSILPARWLIVRSVGTPEPLFLAATLASVFYFQNKKYWLAGIAGAVAMLTKSPGIILFVAYFGSIVGPELKKLATIDFSKWLKSINISTWPILLIPVSLLGVFVLFGATLGDFFAYFHSGDNIHLLFPPFQIFNYSAPWVGTFWLEEVIFIYLIIGLALMKLIKARQTILAWYVGVFLVSIIFVSHRDILRYSLPVIPFVYAAFAKTITKSEFKIVLVALIIPIYLFSLAFISQNVMPVSDWTPLL